MNKPANQNSILKFEFMWWVMTFLVLAAVLLPIYFNIGNFPFYGLNILVIISFITLARHIFLLPYTFVARREKLKVAIVFLCIPLIFIIVQELNTFQTFIDEQGVEMLVGKRPADRQMEWVNFIQNEILLFGVGAVVTGVILPFRLILSVWRGRNRGTV